MCGGLRYERKVSSVESEVNKMRSIKRSGAKEHRIEMEIVVDAYDEWERAMQFRAIPQLQFPIPAIPGTQYLFLQRERIIK